MAADLKSAELRGTTVKAQMLVKKQDANQAPIPFPMPKRGRDGRPQTASLSQQAFNLIRDKILRGEFPPGAILSRRKLGEDFGMSFLPITEALGRLESDGLVESKPRAGTRVRIPSAQDVREHCILREALETQSARLFCEEAGREERLELKRMAKRLDERFSESETNTDADFLFELHTMHVQFHTRIAQHTRCKALCDAIEKNQVLIFNWFYDSTAKRSAAIPAVFHSALAEILSGDDPEAADKAMRRHVRWGVAAVVQQFESLAVGDNIWRHKRSAGRA
jgi:GntR family transcriptional regulator, rspAB operon transcriptional repressor